MDLKSYNTSGHIIHLTHWGRVTHICVGKLNIIGSDNGLSPRRRQAIIWTNAGILLIRPLGTNFSEILFRNQTFSFKKMHVKMSSAKWRPLSQWVKLNSEICRYLLSVSNVDTNFSIYRRCCSSYNRNVTEPRHCKELSWYHCPHWRHWGLS